MTRDTALDIINELDKYARNYDSYEYGLPNFDESTLEQMVLIVLRVSDGAKSFWQGVFMETKVNPHNFKELVYIPGPCDASCKHRWSAFKDMVEPCKSCQHITHLERWVEINTHYTPLAKNTEQANQPDSGK